MNFSLFPEAVKNFQELKKGITKAAITRPGRSLPLENMIDISECAIATFLKNSGSPIAVL